VKMLDELWEQLEAAAPGVKNMPKSIPEGWQIERHNSNGIEYSRIPDHPSTPEDEGIRVALKMRSMKTSYGGGTFRTLWAELTITCDKYLSLRKLEYIKRSFLGGETPAMLLLGPDSKNDEPFPHIVTLRACLSPNNLPDFWSDNDGE